MKQKGGHLDKLISAAGTAMVPFALYQANKMYAKRSKGSSTKRRSNRAKYGRVKSTLRNRRRTKRRKQLKSLKSMFSFGKSRSRSRSRSKRRKSRSRY